MKRSYTQFSTPNHDFTTPVPQAAPLPQIGNPGGQLVINHVPQQDLAFQTPVAAAAPIIIQVNPHTPLNQPIQNHQVGILINQPAHGIIPIQLFPENNDGIVPVQLFFDEQEHNEDQAPQLQVIQIFPAVVEENEEDNALEPEMFANLMTPQGHNTNPNNGMNTGATVGSINLEGIEAPSPMIYLENSFHNDETSSESGDSLEDQDHKVNLMGDFDLLFTSDDFLEDLA